MSKEQSEISVSWSSHFESLGTAFPEMFSTGKFVDVTLACEGRRIHCHRVVLAASSEYFSDLLEENPAQHPIIILPRDVNFWAIKSLVEFIYTGEVSVNEDGFEELIQCAEMLQILGFTSAISQQETNHPKEVIHDVKTEMLEEEESQEDIQEREQIFEINEYSEEGEEPLRSPLNDELFTDGELIPQNSHQYQYIHAEPVNPHELLMQSPSSSSKEKSRNIKSRLLKNLVDKKKKILSRSRLKTCTREVKLPEDSLDIPPENFHLPANGPARSYSAKDMWSALMCVKNGMSINRAAKLHNISDRSVRRFMKRYNIKSKNPQPPGFRKYHMNRNSMK